MNPDDGTQRKKSYKDFLSPMTIEKNNKANAFKLLLQRQHENLINLLKEKNLLNQALVFTGQSALHLAVTNGFEELSVRLIELGAIVDQQDNLGRTALHYACSKGYINMVDLLVQAGADLNKMTYGQETPIMKAAYFTCNKLLKELITRYRDKINFDLENHLKQNVVQIYKMALCKQDIVDDEKLLKWQIIEQILQQL